MPFPRYADFEVPTTLTSHVCLNRAIIDVNFEDVTVDQNDFILKSSYVLQRHTDRWLYSHDIIENRCWRWPRTRHSRRIDAWDPDLCPFSTRAKSPPKGHLLIHQCHLAFAQLNSFRRCPTSADHSAFKLRPAGDPPRGAGGVMGQAAATCCCAAKDDGVEVTAYAVSANDGRHENLIVLRKYAISIHKSEPNDQLGMDVKHRLGRLVVLAIRRHGAVDRANAVARQQGLAAIQVNDVIVEVNGATLDTGMVAQCKSAVLLNVTFIRREHG
eukprot:g1433.t1